jgi:hypothetical protein
MLIYSRSRKSIPRRRPSHLGGSDPNYSVHSSMEFYCFHLVLAPFCSQLSDSSGWRVCMPLPLISSLDIDCSHYSRWGPQACHDHWLCRVWPEYHQRDILARYAFRTPLLNLNNCINLFIKSTITDTGSIPPAMRIQTPNKPSFLTNNPALSQSQTSL